jgi:hypothetical protein
VGVIALLATVALAVVFAFARHVPSEAALLAPAAAAFLIAFFFSYDPYFGDAVRRYSDKGIPWWWVALVAAGAISVGILTRRSPRAGAALTALVPFVVWGTMVGLGND